MSTPSPSPSVTLYVYPKDLKPGVVILFNGGVKEVTTEVKYLEGTTWIVYTDRHPQGIQCRSNQYIAIEG